MNTRIEYMTNRSNKAGIITMRANRPLVSNGLEQWSDGAFYASVAVNDTDSIKHNTYLDAEQVLYINSYEKLSEIFIKSVEKHDPENVDSAIKLIGDEDMSDYMMEFINGY